MAAMKRVLVNESIFFMVWKTRCAHKPAHRD
jgi:hypothetical protein